MRVEAAVEANHQRHAAFFCDRDASLGTATVEIKRLLAEYGLARPRRRFNEIGVGIGRAGYDDRIDLRIGERLLVAAKDRAMAYGQAFGGGMIRINDEAQPRIWMTGDVCRMDGADPPRPKLAESDHGSPFGYAFHFGRKR